MSDSEDQVNRPIGEAVPGWAPRRPPGRVALTGRYCSLDPFDVSAHAPSLFAAFAEDERNVGWVYLPYGPFASTKDFERWCRRTCLGDDPLFFAVLDLETGRAVGMASYLRATPEMGVVEVGHIHFAPQLQRTPAATEAMYLMMRHVFDDLGYRRYEWKCDALNARSRRAASRLGFTFEGVFRQHLIYKGRNRDTAWYSVIDSEWPALRRRFEAWLDPRNFDAEGNQRTSLADMA